MAGALHEPEVDCCDLGDHCYAGVCAGPGPKPRVTAAQRVVEMISSGPAKVETYCTIGKLGVQIEDAE